MSISTSQRLNASDIQANLPAGAGFIAAGGDLPSTNPKTITAVGTDDPTLQTAINAAAAAFVDLAANQATLVQRAQTALTNNQTYLGIASPTNAQVVAQVQALTRQMDAVIRLLVSNFSSTS